METQYRVSVDVADSYRSRLEINIFTEGVVSKDTLKALSIKRTIAFMAETFDQVINANDVKPIGFVQV